jgi:hypothetical protein
MYHTSTPLREGEFVNYHEALMEVGSGLTGFADWTITATRRGPLAHRCPKCRATPGEFCRSDLSLTGVQSPHDERVEVYKQSKTPILGMLEERLAELKERVNGITSGVEDKVVASVALHRTQGRIDELTRTIATVRLLVEQGITVDSSTNWVQA